jgi:hypothetical protein
VRGAIFVGRLEHERDAGLGMVTSDVLDLVRVESRRGPVAPSEPWMKWHAGNGL